MTSPPEQRPPFAAAMDWVSRITTVGIEMVLPGMAGYGLDVWLNTKPYLALIGFAFGMVFGFWHLLRMTGALGEQKVGEQKNELPRDDHQQ